jgi:hypothetical protein
VLEETVKSVVGLVVKLDEK